MSSKRVKIRPQAGGLTQEARKSLSKLLFERMKIKYSRIVEAGDCYAVVCLDEANVDLLIQTNSIKTLKDNGFDLIMPPHLRARKCVIVRGLDSELNTWNEAQLKEDMEIRNEWAKIEEVYRMKNINHMIKIRFQEISMARKACDQGVALHSTHLAPQQIEMEDFIPLTPCFVCYKYDHLTKDCNIKGMKICSECAAIGHTYKECTSTEKKCINCDGTHRTLAAICPIRKELLKEKREEKKKKKDTFEQQNRTYCAVTKMTAELPKAIMNQKPPTTVLQVTDKTTLQIIVLIAEAHIYNMVNPGTFGKRVNQLLQLNGLPRVNLPDDAPSNEIFNVVNRIPEFTATRDEDEDAMEGDDDSDDSNAEVKVDSSSPASASAQPERVTTPTATATQARSSSQPPQYRLSRPPHKQQPRQEESVRPKEQRQPIQKRTQTAATTTKPTQQPQSRQQIQIPESEVGLQFYTYEQSGIPESLPPKQLYDTIREGKVKFTYTESRITENEILRYIREGTLTTTHNKIQTVQASVYKKIRTGLARGSPVDATSKQKQKFTSQ